MKNGGSGFIYRIFQWIVFKVGDLRWLGLKHFPFVMTWSVTEYKIDINEVMNDAFPLLEPGDIILHRSDGYVSNCLLGNGMIHAGLYMGDGQVVEAVSDGVVRRHVGHILYSDRACILRPRVSDSVKKVAIGWADRIVGFPYDCLFDFNEEKERKLVDQKGKGAIGDGVKFCCTEIPYFCYLDYADPLGIKRRKNVSFLTWLVSLFGLNAGTYVVDADMYVRANFDVVWCSKEMTAEWCEKMKLGDEYCAKIFSYWKERSRSSSK